MRRPEEDGLEEEGAGHPVALPAESSAEEDRPREGDGPEDHLLDDPGLERDGEGKQPGHERGDDVGILDFRFGADTLTDRDSDGLTGC